MSDYDVMLRAVRAPKWRALIRLESGQMYRVRGRPLMRDCTCARREQRYTHTQQLIEPHPRCYCR